MLHLIFDVSSGVDGETLALNLSALANLPKVKYVSNAAEQNADTSYFIAYILLGWFVAMGFSVSQVQDWLKHCIETHFNELEGDPHPEGPFATLEQNLRLTQEFFSMLEYHDPSAKQPTHYPLPSFVDVR